MRRYLITLLLAAALPAPLFSPAARAADGDAAPQDSTPVASVPLEPNRTLTVNAYLGMVNGQPLFAEDVLQPIDADLQRMARLAHTVSDFRIAARDAVDKQIRNQVTQLLEIKSAKEGLTEEDDKRISAHMNQYTKDLLTKYQGSKAKADQDLRARGSSWEKDLAQEKQKVIIELYVYKTIDPKVVVTRRMIAEEYQRDIKEFTVPAEVDLYMITLDISKYLKDPESKKPLDHPTDEQIKQATAQTMTDAKALVAQIKAGADFSALAQDNSTDAKKKFGGRWPHMQKGVLASEQIESLAFSLPPNTVADPIVITDTDHPDQSNVVIVRVGDVTVARFIPFEEAQKSIKKRLTNHQFTTLQDEYYKKIMDSAAIEGVDHMIDSAVDSAVTRYLVR